MTRSTIALALGALILTACTDDSPFGGGDARVLISGIVFAADGETTYLSLLPSLDVDTVDFTQALELPGRGSAAVFGDKVYAVDGESPTLRRYRIENGALVEEDSMSFMSYGFASLYIDPWGLTFISETKAYLFNTTGVVVVFDPQAMMITGTIETPQLLREGLQLDSSPAVVRGNRLFRMAYWKNWDEYYSTEEQYLLVFDTENDMLLDMVSETRCPALGGAVTQAEDGTLYFGNWGYNVTETLVSGAPSSCALRILPGADGFDPTWTLAFPELTDGREAAGFSYVGDGKAVLTVFHDEEVTIDESTDPSALALSAVWKLWYVDIEAGTAAPMDTLGFVNFGNTIVRVEGRTLLLVTRGDYTGTDVHEIGDGGATRTLFTIPAWTYQMYGLP